MVQSFDQSLSSVVLAILRYVPNCTVKYMAFLLSTILNKEHACKVIHVEESVANYAKHEYLLILYHREYFVVDLSFRDQLSVARPSSTLQKLLNQTPTVLVKRASEFLFIIHMMCNEIRKSFETCPPWREKANILKKWATVIGLVIPPSRVGRKEILTKPKAPHSVTLQSPSEPRVQIKGFTIRCPQGGGS